MNVHLNYHIFLCSCLHIVLRTLFLFEAYNDKVVAFFRQPNIAEILKEKHRSFASNIPLKNKVHLIRSEGGGVEALEKFSNDVELILLLR